MTELQKLNAKTVSQRMNAGDFVVIDIREKDEYAREHIKGAISLPLSQLDKTPITIDAHQKAVFHCRSGMRTDENCARLAAHATGDAFILEGGLNEWKKAGLPLAVNKSAPLEINRQVQITAGTLILLGVLLGFLVHPALFAISAFVGAGLTFAGISGWCGMALLLNAMPWNRTAPSQI